MDRQPAGWTNKSPPVFYRTLSPSGPLPCLSFQFTTMQSRATGIADHILPLGDLFRYGCNKWIANRKRAALSYAIFPLPFWQSLLIGVFSATESALLSASALPKPVFKISLDKPSMEVGESASLSVSGEFPVGTQITAEFGDNAPARLVTPDQVMSYTWRKQGRSVG